jgi:diguanylate cyclase (GGDEF)-like protein
MSLPLLADFILGIIMNGTLFSRLHIRLLILILISAAPAFGILIYSGFEQRDQALAVAERQSLAIVRGITARQQLLLKQSHEMLRHLAMDPGLRAVVRERSCGDMLSRTRASLAHYMDFFVADLGGDIVCSHNAAGVGLNISDRAYFQRAIATFDFAVGDYQISRITRQSTIILAHPIFDELGRMDSVIAIGLELGWLGDLVSGAALPEDSILTLVDANGVILARTPDPEGWVGRDVPDRSEFLRAVASGGQGAYESLWLDNVRRLTYVYPLYPGKSGGIYVRVGVPRQALFAEINESLMRNTLLMLVGLICALMVGWVASERLVLRRVRDLAATARLFGSGDLDARPRIAPDGGELGDLARAFEDMASGLTEHQQLIEYLATRDSLTKLPNQSLFLDRAAQAMAGAVRHKRCLAIALISIDRLNVISDSLGRGHGDLLLLAVAQRLESIMRGEDTLARFEAGEFAVLWNNLEGTADAVAAAAQLVDGFFSPFLVDGEQLHVSLSVGVAFYPDDGESVQTLVKHAYSAMHRVSDAGGNGVQCYAPQMSADAAERLRIEQALRRALERNEFELHYQPKVDLATGSLAGVEALIRWRHPEMGMIAPDRFIPLAEETGLIVPIGEWVLRHACEQIRAWKNAGLPPVSVAVNLSARQFWHGALPPLLSRLLAETGVDPCLIELEVTESAIMRDMDATVEALYALRELGASISIDDFGTGYSSLGYLRRLPLNKLKIDRSFIRDITQDPCAAMLTRQIISIAHALGLTVVAEGVEHEAEWAFLSQNECDQIQGYYFSRPVPATDIQKLLEEDKHWAVYPL